MLENSTLLNVEQTFSLLNFEYIDQFLVALILMSLTVIFHGMGMNVVRQCFKRFGRPLLNAPHVVGRTFVMSSIVAIMLVSHFFGIAI